MIPSRVISSFALASVFVCPMAFAGQSADFSASTQSLPPTEFEAKTYSLLKTLVNDLSDSKDVRVEMVSGTSAVEYQVFFHPNDEAPVRGLSGVTQSSLATLVNELSIASQKDEARLAHRPFYLHARKYVLLRFIKLEN